MIFQTAPQALLGAFDLKVTGHNPREFTDAVYATLAVDDYYFLANRESLQGVNAAVTIAGDIAALPNVPSGEVWRLEFAMAAVNLQNGTTAAMGAQVGIQYAQGQSSQAIAVSDSLAPIAAVAGVAQLVVGYSGKPFLLQSGGQLQAVNYRPYGAVAASMFIRAYFTRFKS